MNSNILSQANIPAPDSGNDRFNMICYLLTPKIMTMSKNRMKYFFQVSPSSLCSKHLYEHYIFRWTDLNSLNQVGSIDVAKILEASNKSEKEFIVKVNEGGNVVNYEIIAEDPDDCNKYSTSLHFLSIVIRTKLRSNK
jgi:hypothetical protein